MKWLLRIVALGLVVAVGYVGYNVWNVRHWATQDQAEKADAIVVLGAAQYNGEPSPVLKARLDHAADLYKRRMAPVVVVTGGAQEGDANTEASASAAYLAGKGVPDEVVLREVQGRNSWSSLQASARFMKQRDIQKIILVSDPFHSARIRQMAADLGLEPLVSPTKTSPIKGDAQRPYYAKEVVALSVGRIFGWSRLASMERDFSANWRQ